jgi:hypothetical protein
MIEKIQEKRTNSNGYIYTDNSGIKHMLIPGCEYKYKKKDDTFTTYQLLAVSNVTASDDKRNDYPLLVTYQDTESKEIWTKPVEKFVSGITISSLNNRQKRFESVSAIEIEQVEFLSENSIYLDWSAKGIGFGQFSLHVNEDGKPVLSLELMSKEFAKTLLCKIVDDAIIES